VAELGADPSEAVAGAGADPPDWWEVLAELDGRRAVALTALDPDLIADYAEPGSPAWSADAALVADLRERGLRPQGLTSRVLAVERSERRGEQVQVQIVDQRSAYTLLDAGGSVVESVPEAGLTRWWVTLVQRNTDPPGWRVVDVTTAMGGQGWRDGPGSGPDDASGDTAARASGDSADKAAGAERGDLPTDPMGDVEP
jgi:hypothetical protein